MKYSDGQEVLIGDKVQLGNDRDGVVVCSIDHDAYSQLHPREKWSYLKKGVVIEFPSYGLIHYEDPEIDLIFLSRGSID